MKLAQTLSLLLVLFAVAACKKDSNNSNTPNSEYYFTGSIGGKSVNWQASDTGEGWAVGSGSVLSNDGTDVTGGITALLTDYPAQLPQLGIEFKTIDVVINTDASSAFYNFINTGAWSYSNTSTYNPGNKSLVVRYTDANGNQYSSIGTQSGTANIISATKVSGDAYNSNAGLKIKMTLNCTLYPVSGSGNSITLTNGQATLFLENMLTD